MISRLLWVWFLAVLLTVAETSSGLCQQAVSAAPDSTAKTTGPLSVVGDFLGDLFDISMANVSDKLMRILGIVLIALIARIFMAGVKAGSRFLVYSDWGPLKFIFRNHQRSITMHSLVISLTKYVVYLTALGYILSELGVNYTTFLASLSLVGIAVGFGSQGLVQDIVTGFFILFENQFSVGDMVEISGQIGIVEEIGLRTTRIRNYFGADVIFQNRNIPLVGKYRRGSFEVIVDVAIASEESAEKAGQLLGSIGTDFSRQFEEIVLEQPEVKGVLDLETGEVFVRMYAKLWPGQQWVVDAQLVPRIREIFKREEIEIPSDRVVAFYHAPPDAVAGRAVFKSVRDLVNRARVHAEDIWTDE